MRQTTNRIRLRLPLKIVCKKLSAHPAAVSISPSKTRSFLEAAGHETRLRLWKLGGWTEMLAELGELLSSLMRQIGLRGEIRIPAYGRGMSAAGAPCSCMSTSGRGRGETVECAKGNCLAGESTEVLSMTTKQDKAEGSNKKKLPREA